VTRLGAVSGRPGRDETVLIGENNGLHPIAQAELSQHPSHVSLDCGLGDGQCRRYLRVGQAGGEQPENLDLPRGQLP
jgi:hypothetical protein